MAERYKVAQLRKNNSTTYMTDINVSTATYESSNKFSDNETSGIFAESFQDFALQLEGNLNFQPGQVYYLRFLIHRVPDGFYSQSIPNHRGAFKSADDLIFTLVLVNEKKQSTDVETTEVIDSFTVESLATSETNIGRNTVYYARTLVFSPHHKAQKLVFRLARGAYDALIKPRTWLTDGSTNIEIQTYDGDGNQKGTVSTYGSRIIYSQGQQQSGDFCKLVNIMPDEKWIKIGYQCRPGSLIVVNNEPIVVGKSGIYEINNGTEITSFMIASPGGSNPDNIDAFLLDYAYDDSDE